MSRPRAAKGERDAVVVFTGPLQSTDVDISIVRNLAEFNSVECWRRSLLFFFFLNDPAPPEIPPFPLHAPLPIRRTPIRGGDQPPVRPAPLLVGMPPSAAGNPGPPFALEQCGDPRIAAEA